MDPLDYLDQLLNGGDDLVSRVPCPECGGQGWDEWWSAGGGPPEQRQCERCYGDGHIYEHELTEAERVQREMGLEDERGVRWPDVDEEQDDPDGLLDDDDSTDESDDGPPSSGVSC